MQAYTHKEQEQVVQVHAPNKSKQLVTKSKEKRSPINLSDYRYMLYNKQLNTPSISQRKC